MALDKQKILHELGSVVNQLQSADCGCMGKLFSNSNQPNQNGNYRNAPMMNPAHDGCMRGGCCHGNGYPGCNAPSAGEPFSGNRNCMGFCNPPKLYADTYNYLNNNLMQPVVKEVYNDLKSITPANTMMNSPMGAKMGLMQGNNPNIAAPGAMPGQMGGMAQNQMPGQMGGMAQNPMPGQMGGMAQNQMPGHIGMGGMAQNQMPGQMGGMAQNQMPGQMGGMAQNQMPGQMGGMAQNQMPGQMGGMAQNQMPGQMGGMAQNQMPGQMGGMAQNQMPGSVNQNAIANHHGPNVRFANTNMPMANQNQMGRTAPQTMAPGQRMGNEIVNMMMGDSNRTSNLNQGGAQGLVSNNAPQSPGMGQFNGGIPGNAPNNMGMVNNRQGNLGAPMQNPNVQYMSQPNGFAGANTNMQGNAMDGRMGQINPGSQQMQSMSPAQPQMNTQNPGYGQHSAGMSKFNEMFPGVMKGDLGFDPMAIAIQMNPANQQQAAMNTMQKLMMSNGKGLDANAALLQPVVNATNAAMANVIPPPNVAPTSQQQPAPGDNAGVVPAQNNQVPPQQAQPGAHNTGAAVAGTLPTVYEGTENPNAIQDGSLATRSPPPTTQQMIKEPIFPADTSRNMQHAQMNKFKHQEYNTLGQPVELLPAYMYHTPDPILPQTLSPQSASGNYPGRYSNVKATVSKTALMGNKPIGRTPSKGQLQQIYNQYKGSHSYTQQNIRPPENGASYSDGHLNVTQGNVIPQSPIEKIAGDTAANNAMNNQAHTTGHKPGQVGDVPAANKPHGEGGAHSDAEKAPVATNSNLRNGLQDMKYTAYATTAAWSFHGATPAPYSASYRFRYKA